MTPPCGGAADPRSGRQASAGRTDKQTLGNLGGGIVLNPKVVRRFRRIARWLIAEPYKRLLGYTLAFGLRVNYFDYPPGRWPPPTPARKYIDEFLSLYQHEVRGRCVEFAPPYYREKFSNNPNVTSYDVWDIEPGEGITIIGDLQDASHIPDSSFDTIICTHVLCCIPRPWLAVAELHRILSPGGLVLCTNPVVAPKYAPHPKDCWRFTYDSMEILFSNFKKVNIHCFGNAATAAASPFFLMTYHLPRWVLEMHDEYCPIVVAVAAWK